MKQDELIVVFEFLAKALKEDKANSTSDGDKKSTEKFVGVNQLLTDNVKPKYTIDLDDTTKTTHIKELMDRVDDKYKTTEEDQIKNLLSNQKKQFEDTIKSLKADLLSVLKSSDEPKSKPEVTTKDEAVRFKEEFKHGFGQAKTLGE